MAINQNHLFEELNGVKCGIAEKNVPGERAAFLKDLLEANGFEVVVAASPPPKAAPAQPGTVPAATAETAPVSPMPVAPETFTVGVTDITFNPINAIFGRLLRTRNGHVVTLAYWHQKEAVSRDDLPYFQDPASRW